MAGKTANKRKSREKARAAARTRAQRRERRIPDARLAADIRPSGEDPGMLYQRGLQSLHAGRAADATQFFARAAAIDGANPDTLNALGVAQMQSGETGTAFETFRRTVAMAPGFVDARVNFGIALATFGETEAAGAEFHRALELNNRCAEAMIGLAELAEKRGELDQAKRWLERALALDEGAPVPHNNLGNVLGAMGRPFDAIAELERALALNPNYADAHANMALMLMRTNRHQAALMHAEQALSLNPGHWDAAFNRAVALLALGRFAEGWAAYLVRDRVQAVGAGLTRSPLPVSLAGKHVLVLPDQGLGDEIFFLRFARALKARGARVSYRPKPKIASLIARLATLDHTLAPDVPDPTADYAVSVCDLPHLLGHAGMAEIPASIRIPPLDGRLAEIDSALAQIGPPPYLGVTWRAGTTHNRNGLFKQAPMEGLARAAANFPGTIIALQRKPGPGEIAAFADALGRPAHDFSAANDDLEAMFALQTRLDDYVCVSNTNVHLREAAGRTSRVLVPNPPEFRWMAASIAATESPWFPGSTLYRQEPDTSWDAPLARLADDLGANP